MEHEHFDRAVKLFDHALVRKHLLRIVSPCPYFPDMQKCLLQELEGAVEFEPTLPELKAECEQKAKAKKEEVMKKKREQEKVNNTRDDTN